MITTIVIITMIVSAASFLNFFIWFDSQKTIYPFFPFKSCPKYGHDLERKG